MIKHIKRENILFLDIETVPATEAFSALDPQMQSLWTKKAKYLARSEDDSPEKMYSRAGIYAEFGKVICISCGFFHKDSFRIKSFYGDDEQKLLKDFAEMLSELWYSRHHYLCAHNGKEFDYPYLARRMIISNIPIPVILDHHGKKPWEVKHLDTMELWKFGDWKNYTSLELMATIMGIETPKDDIDGSMVGETYWKEKNLMRIVKYCEKDTITVARIYQRFNSLPQLENANVIHSNGLI